jgi:hypothetical protein
VVGGKGGKTYVTLSVLTGIGGSSPDASVIVVVPTNTVLVLVERTVVVPSVGIEGVGAVLRC